MKICFVLPKFTRQPIGGYKIVFEYANRLQNRGHNLAILFLNDNALRQFHMPDFVRSIAANYITSVEPKWFPLDNRIKKISSLEKKFMSQIEDSDAVFATGIQTVSFVQEHFSTAQKLYLIQGYENWGVTEDYLHGTYRCGFINIAVSNWLKEVVDKYAGRETFLLKNPIDTKIYQNKVSQNDRKPHTIGLLYHTEKIKGVEYAIQAIRKLKKRYPDLTVQMFGMFPKPNNLPDWINYKRGIAQEETVDIYNQVQVFLCASIEEGYGMTGLEAMACGACLVSTSYKGVLEYAKNEYNALLSPVKDVDLLVENVSKIFDQPTLRDELTRNGVESVKKYSWDKTIDKLESILSHEVNVSAERRSCKYDNREIY